MLLESHSYDELSIAEITRRAELTRPAFYFHFASKGAVVAAVLEDLLDEFVAVAQAWYQHRDGDPLLGVEEALAATVDLWRSHARLVDALLRAAAVDPEAAELVEGWADELGARAAERLRHDLGDPLPGDGPGAGALARFMVGAMVDTMRRDVRAVVAGSPADDAVLATLAFVWRRILAE